MAAANATPAPMTAAQQEQMNAAQTAFTLANSTAYHIKGSPVTGALGTTFNLAMPNSGIMLGCDLHVTCSADVADAMTAGPLGAVSMINNIQTTDWYGNTRHNTSGSRLNSLVEFMLGRPWDKVPTAFDRDSANLLYNLPTAVGTADINFTLHVPLTAPGGLKGALLTQTSNGTCFVNVGTLSSTAMVSSTNPDAPYSAGTATFGSVTITPYWRFLMPSSFNEQTLPLLALSTAFSIQDVRSQSNLTASAQNYMNFPAARKISAQLLDFVNGTERNFGSDVEQLQIIVNGATPIETYSAGQKLIQQRNRLGADSVPGRYYFNYGNAPVNTETFGSYQSVLTPSTVNSGAHSVLTSQMTYPMGEPLPGLAV